MHNDTKDKKNRKTTLLRLVYVLNQWVYWTDYCPEYNTGANTLDTVPCNVSTGSCPDVLFRSNEVYKCKILNNYLIITISRRLMETWLKHLKLLNVYKSTSYMANDKIGSPPEVNWFILYNLVRMCGYFFEHIIHDIVFKRHESRKFLVFQSRVYNVMSI